MPDFTPEKWESWLKDKTYAEERVEHLEDELDKALDGEMGSVPACEHLGEYGCSSPRVWLSGARDS